MLNSPDTAAMPPFALENGQLIATTSGRAIDLTGYHLLPGIVDLHGDAFERHLAPRRGAVRDLAPGLNALEAELAANGITTAYLAQFWSWEGGMRAPEFALRMADALAAHDALLDLRLQLRLEVGCHADFDAALALIEAHDIGYVVFNDHLPHDRLAAGKRPARLEGQALKSGRSPADHLALLQRLHAEMPASRAKLPALASALCKRGVLLGSHDDHTAAARAEWRGLGARVAEFPTSLATAQAAREAGDLIVMGAPNVVRGGSHGKGVSARELIAAGLCDALVSDYHYPAPHLAAFALHDEGMPLAEAWALISERPARALGLMDRGVIGPGMRADLVIVEQATRRIAGTICKGRIAYLSGELAHRMIEPLNRQTRSGADAGAA